MTTENGEFYGHLARRILFVVAAKLPAVFVGATLLVSLFCWMAALATGARRICHGIWYNVGNGIGSDGDND